MEVNLLMDNNNVPSNKGNGVKTLLPIISSINDVTLQCSILDSVLSQSNLFALTGVI